MISLRLSSFGCSWEVAKPSTYYPLDLRSSQSSVMLADYHVLVFQCSRKLISNIFTEALIFQVLIDQFRYIKIQLKTIDFNTRLLGINPTNSVVIPMSLVLSYIVLG